MKLINTIIHPKNKESVKDLFNKVIHASIELESFFPACKYYIDYKNLTLRTSPHVIDAFPYRDGLCVLAKNNALQEILRNN